MPLKMTRKDERDAALLLTRIGPHVTRSLGQPLAWQWEVQVDMHLLADLVDFPDEIPDAERRKLVRRAIGRIPPDEPLTVQVFLPELQKATDEYRRRPLRPFVLLATVSVGLPRRRLEIAVDGARIVLTRRLPKTYRMPRAVTEGDNARGAPRNAWVRVYVEARCELAAFDRAYSALSYLRAVWNLRANGKKQARESFGRMKPVNEILLGRIVTIHHPNGTPATENYWTERAPVGLEPSGLLMQQDAKVRSFERTIRRRLSRVSFRSQLLAGLIHYGEALDDDDMANAFLKLWVALELLVGRREELNRRVPQRASFVFPKDREYHQVVLNRLQAARNRIVHQSDAPEEAEALLFKLKAYVEQMLRFMLGTAGRFESFEDFLVFLDLPRQADDLKRRLDIHRLANTMWK